jgi:hypothetical protein
MRFSRPSGRERIETAVRPAGATAAGYRTPTPISNFEPSSRNGRSQKKS